MNRRDLLKRGLCAAASSALFTAMGAKLNIAHAAVNGGRQLLGTDYRALVCIYLYGGNDSFNMVVPRDNTNYNIYAASRAGLALPQGDLIALNPAVPPVGGGSYGLAPGMSGLANLFNAGRVSVVANVGPLIEPITKAEYEAGSVPVPRQLFSHSDQTVVWQTPSADTLTRTGWGGRLADMFAASNPNQQLSMNISIAGENVFQAGNSVVPYFLDTNGVEAFNFIADVPWEASRRSVFTSLRDLSHGHAMQRQYSGSVRRAMDNEAMVTSALDGVSNLGAFPDTWLGRQLAMVARLMQVRSTLQMQRQIFFVGLGGFDTHDAQLTAHSELMTELADAMAAFYNETVALNIEDQVTTFTASEFGRTVTINGDGTDHGWGSHHFVMGGRVNGQRIFGTMPNLTLDGPQDAGWGQIIPDLAVDQYAATLARWYGLSDGDRADVFPNIGNFSQADLGFMLPPV